MKTNKSKAKVKATKPPPAKPAATKRAAAKPAVSKPAAIKAEPPKASKPKAPAKKKAVVTPPASNGIPIRLHAPAALTVYIAGTFNNWTVGTHPLSQIEGGEWMGELPLPLGRYEYLFVVDGNWIPDPAAGESVPNEFGGLNSVLLVN